MLRQQSLNLSKECTLWGAGRYRSDHEQGEGRANTTRGQSGLSGSLASGTSPRQDAMEEHMKDKGP